MADLFLIDDQAEVLASYTQILTGALPDLQITTFSSAEAALESLKSTEPDLILADVALPGMSGWDLCREIRSRIPDRHLPLVLITGVRTRPEDKIRGLEAGAELYLTKPVDPGELVAQVKAMLRLKSLEDELREEKRTLEQRVRQQAIDLLETESQFQMLYQSLSIGMYRSTPDGEVLLANDALAHMLGYDSADELLSRNLNEGIYEPGYDRSAFLRRLEAEGRIQGLESIWRRRDGTEIYVRESAWARRDEKGAILSIDGTVEDITREREIRTELENERLLFRSGPMVVFRWRAGEDSIPVDYVSPNVESIYGYSVQEFLEGNLGYKELIHPEDRQRVEKEVAAYVEQNRPSFNQRYRLRDKQGSYHWVHDLTAVVRDRQGRVSSYVGFITDITEMIEISRELEKKDVLIRQVFEQAMEGIIVTDEAGTISEWSHGMETITGLGAEEVQGRPIWEIQARFVPRKQQSPRLEDRIRKEIEGILQTGEFKHFNPAAIFPLQSTDGSIKLIRQLLSVFRTAKGYGLVGFIRDETEAVTAERTLEETKARYETLFKMSPDGFILEDARGNILDCNPASCEILGFPRSKLTTMNVRDLTLPQYRKKVEQNIRTILKEGYLRHEVENTRQDGTRVVLELHEVRIPLGKGEDGILVIHRDITERKRIEEDLRRRDRILSAVAEAGEMLLSATPWEKRFNQALEHLGKAASATRVAILENIPDPKGGWMARHRVHWAASGFSFQEKAQQTSFRELGLERWVDILGAKKVIAARVADLPPQEQAFFRRIRCQSVLAIPIFTGTEWWGTLDLDDSREERIWTEAEIESLTIAADLIGSAIQQERLTSAVTRLAEAVTIQSAADFFQSLVTELYNVLGCDFAFVGELISREPERVQTLAFIQDGTPAENFTYDLKGTPCENVVGKAYQQYTTHIQEQFPDDTLLQEMGIDSYCGMPLFSAEEQPLGIIVVMSRTPMPNPSLVESLLKIFAVRAGAELERRRAMELITESEEKFRLAFQTSPDAVNINRLSDGLYVEINEGFTQITGYTWDDVRGKTSADIQIWDNPEDRERLVRALRDKGVCANLEARFRFKDGTVHTGLMSARVIQMNGEPHILSITRDIEDRYVQEQKIRESEIRYRKLVDQTPVAIGIHSGGKWRFINQEGARLMGYDSYEELLGTPVLNVVHPDSQKVALERIRYIAKTGKPVPIAEEKLLRKDGTTVYTLVTSSPISYKGEPSFQVTALDITALKEAESEIQILTEAVEQSPSIVMITDLDGRIEYVNPRFREVTGYEDDEVIGKVARLMRKKHHTPESYRDLWETITSGRAWQGEFLNKKKDGTSYWESATISPVVDVENQPRHFLLAIEDITEKKETQQKLLESEAKFRSIFEESLDTIFLSTPEARILDINQAGEDLFGYSRKELLRMNARDLYANPEDRDAFVDRILAQGYVKDYQVDLRRKDGTIRTCLLTVKALESGDQENRQLAGLIHDITDRELQRRQLEEALEKAQEGERVKTLFLANMSHEIRTPLNSILGFVDVLRRKEMFENQQEQNEVIDIIQASGQRLMRTVHEILDISQLEAGAFTLNPEPLNLNQLIKQVTKEHSSTIKMRGLELIVLTEVRKPMIFGDMESILKALSNLVDNAIKYTPSGTIQIRLKREQGKYAVYVQDSGIGISKDYMQRMYEAFSQESTGFTKKYQGLGLGLSITKRCLDLNHVPISVESEKEKGTTFRLEFTPWKPETKQKKPQTRTTELEPPPAEVYGDVLVVEDDPSSQMLMEYFLKSRYDLSYAVSVREALEILQEKQPLIVLLDVSLAGDEDGLDLVRTMRSSDQWKSIPVIALTAHAFVTDRDRCLAAGCNDYLSKPVRQSQLLERIQELTRTSG